jgi:small subunit ribosomal protein S21
MARVQLRPDESPESLIKRFRKSVTESGVLKDLRRKRWYMSPSEIRRLEKKKAIRRSRRKSQQRSQR